MHIVARQELYDDLSTCHRKQDFALTLASALPLYFLLLIILISTDTII